MEIRDLVKIERELQRQVLAASGAGMRASLFNLVVFERKEQSGLADPALSALFGLRPARVLRSEAGHRGRTEVEVSARCSGGGADRAVCFEEIRIRGGEDGLSRDPGCWTPLLIPGVPVNLWWLEPLEAILPLLGQFEECADRLIVDTGLRERAGDDPLWSLRLLAGELESVGALSDLAWRRILPLRSWAARLFDPPANREALERIERVRLEGGLRSEGGCCSCGWPPAWAGRRSGWRTAPGCSATGRGGRCASSTGPPPPWPAASSSASACGTGRPCPCTAARTAAGCWRRSPPRAGSRSA